MRSLAAACGITLLGFMAQAANPAAEAARVWRVAHEQAILDEFIALLSIPNLAADGENIRRNATAVSTLLARRGVTTKLLEIPSAPPVVFGEIRTPGARRTIVFYAHYDGQPLNSKEWTTEPWKPVMRDGRIYARSASDDKAPIVALATALDAIHAAGLRLQSNVKFVFEGEEEAGSPHLGEILTRYQDLLASDVWLICDGPVHQSGRQQIVFGARGVATIDLTVYGPNRELHSGHYGNWAPNPAMMLSRLLASMKDDDGRILVPRFYDGIEPLTTVEQRALAEAPNIDADLMRELGLGRTEGGGKRSLELITQPSLNVRGMAASRIGAQANNVIPSTATATIDMRLVKGITGEQAVSRVRDHIRNQGYFIVDGEPDAQTRAAHPKIVKLTVERGGYNAARTSMELPISQLVIRTVESARGPSVKLPTSGGSVPLVVIEGAGKAPTILIPFANHDNNQHSFNENIRVQNLWDGIELMAALLAM